MEAFETFEPQRCEWTYNVTMVQHVTERKQPLTFQGDIRAANAEEAIMLMKNELWEGGWDEEEISVLSATRIIDWN